MMLLAPIPSVFLLLLEQCVYEVYEMDPETSGVTRYLLLICVDLTSNIARARLPSRSPYIRVLLSKVPTPQPFPDLYF